MKFEITSFVAALVVYLVRLRAENDGESTSLQSSDFLQNRSTLCLSDLSTGSGQELKNSVEAHLSAMQGASSSSRGMYSAAGFVRGCSRAVAVVAGAVLFHLVA